MSYRQLLAQVILVDESNRKLHNTTQTFYIFLSWKTFEGVFLFSNNVLFHRFLKFVLLSLFSLFSSGIKIDGATKGGNRAKRSCLILHRTVCFVLGISVGLLSFPIDDLSTLHYTGLPRRIYHEYLLLVCSFFLASLLVGTHSICRFLLKTFAVSRSAEGTQKLSKKFQK